MVAGEMANERIAALGAGGGGDGGRGRVGIRTAPSPSRKDDDGEGKGKGGEGRGLSTTPQRRMNRGLRAELLVRWGLYGGQVLMVSKTFFLLTAF